MNQKKKWLHFLSPEHSIVRYVVGTAVLTAGIQVVYDQFKDSLGLIGVYTLLAGLTLIAALLFWFDAARARKEADIDVDVEPIEPHTAVIILISPGNNEIPTQILEHHQTTLTHVWLLSTTASTSTAIQMAEMIKTRWPSIRVHPIGETIVDSNNIESTWEMVERIYTRWAPNLGLQSDHVIADITGGTKLMTAGMTLACVSPERNMEYVFTPRELKDGSPKEHAPRVLVKIST